MMCMAVAATPDGLKPAVHLAGGPFLKSLERKIRNGKASEEGTNLTP
jgi:hypothetical protein